MNIKKIIFDKLNNLTTQKFNEDSDINQIGIDSLDLVELVCEVEQEFNIQISDEVLKNIKKVKDIILEFEKLNK